ncbi:MAG: radical SAM protein [Spirochaetaceae bacterium]|jgi:pyruvate-formate lyase-activating enzyme|nr:radical SAM protein [Spirochaetaceae bacterium]
MYLLEELTCSLIFRSSEELPEPAISLNIDKKGKQWISMLLTRGCPLHCQFCSNFLTQGRLFRPTPLEKLQSQLETLEINLTKPVHINLEDDNLLVRKSYFKEVLTLLKKKIPHSTFSIDNGLDYTNMTDEFINYLIETGFTSFTLSLGSSDLETLKKEKRPGNLKRFEEVLVYLTTRKISVSTFLICGLPEDSRESILASLTYLHQLPTEINFYPIPGLPRFEDTDLFLTKSPHLCCGSSAYPWGKSLTTAEMVTVFRLARLSNLIKKEHKTSDEIQFINKILETKRLRSFIGKKKEIISVSSMDEFLVEGFLEKTSP